MHKKTFKKNIHKYFYEVLQKLFLFRKNNRQTKINREFDNIAFVHKNCGNVLFVLDSTEKKRL